MKRIEAIIKPQQLDTVKEKLAGAGVDALTVTEASGHGRNGGHRGMFRGVEYGVDFDHKIHVVVVVADERVSRVIDAVVDGARTGAGGDGKIFVTPVEDAIRIRTGERGPSSL